jgi:hypothetical protein
VINLGGSLEMRPGAVRYGRTKPCLEVYPQNAGCTGWDRQETKNRGLSRHWRNSRTQASHDPASWKYHHSGNFILNDIAPSNHGQL